MRSEPGIQYMHCVECAYGGTLRIKLKASSTSISTVSFNELPLCLSNTFKLIHGKKCRPEIIVKSLSEFGKIDQRAPLQIQA